MSNSSYCTDSSYCPSSRSQSDRNEPPSTSTKPRRKCAKYAERVVQFASEDFIDGKGNWKKNDLTKPRPSTITEINAASGGKAYLKRRFTATGRVSQIHFDTDDKGKVNKVTLDGKRACGIHCFLEVTFFQTPKNAHAWLQNGAGPVMEVSGEMVAGKEMCAWSYIVRNDGAEFSISEHEKKVISDRFLKVRIRLFRGQVQISRF